MVWNFLKKEKSIEKLKNRIEIKEIIACDIPKYQYLCVCDLFFNV